MRNELETNNKSCLLLGDIGVHSFEKELLKYPGRVFNAGILEQSMIGIASGLSMGGLFPTVHTISPFLILRALEQIKLDFAFQELGGNLVSVGSSIDYAALGSTHHCPEDVRILSTIPSIEIMVPGNSTELELMLQNTITNSKLTYTRLSELENKTNLVFEFKKITKVKHGEKGTVLTIGPMLDSTIDACKELDVTILYCNVVKPIDLETIESNLVGGKLIIVEPFFSNSIVNVLLDADFLLNKVTIFSIGFPLKFFKKYGTLKENLKDLQLDNQGLRIRIERILNDEHNR
jgi:transketolase